MDANPVANVYIATLDGLYTRSEGAAAGTAWQDISPNVHPPYPYACDASNECRRFESIAVSADGMVLLAGTSQPVVPQPTPPLAPQAPSTGVVPPPRIFKSTNRGLTWTLTSLPTMPSRAWAEQYRVRDIQMGTTSAYAAIEGSGIYRLDMTTVAPLQRRR